MHELLSGFGLIILYFLICASTALLIRYFTPIPSEVFRKLLHLILLGSLLVWLFVFPTWWISALTAVLFALIVFPILSLAEKIKGFSHLLTERKTGEIKKSLLIVFSMYAIVVCICWGWIGDKLLALASIYAWGIGDAMAALVGKRFGKHTLSGKHIDGHKSIEGSCAMFTASFLSVLLILLIRGGLSWYAYPIIACCTASISAQTELCTPNGMDTITCPLAAMVILLPLTAAFGGIL